MTTMCREASVPRGNLSDLKMGRSEILSTKNLNKIANYFDVSVDFLLGNENEKKPVGPKANGLESTGYERLTPENRKMIDSLIDSLLKSQSGE